MTDFTQIDHDTFLRYKDAAGADCKEYQKLNDKISGILDKFSCFQEFSAFQSYTKTKKPSHFHNNNHHHQHHHAPIVKRKPIFDPTQSGTDRTVTALLNKISKRNFIKICRDVLMLVTPYNIENITNTILEKSQRQPGFLELYIGLLHEIYGKSTNDIKIKVQEILTKYIEGFIETRNFTDFQLDSKDYNEFCCNLNNKNQIIGKHKTILALISKIMRGTLIDEYFNIMFNEIIQMDKNVRVPDQFERHELLLDIMTDFVKADSRFQVHVDKYYSSHVSILNSYSLKARFKVMDITCVTFIKSSNN